MFFIKKCFTNSNDKKVAIEKEKIFFGWQMESERENVVQNIYEIKLFNSNKELIWETGKVQSKESINIYYDGTNLESRNEYYWKVKVWNNYDEIAESDFNFFEIGLDTEDWQAKWIEADMELESRKEEFNFGEIFSYHPDPREIENISLDPPAVFSKEFLVENKEITRARIYVTAHGVYEAELNGEKVGDEYLAPGFTTYPKLQYYQTYNITNQIKKINNEIKITVADGWYKSRIGLAGIGHQFGDNVSLLAQIEIEYMDGEKTIIGTDESYTATT